MDNDWLAKHKIRVQQIIDKFNNIKSEKPEVKNTENKEAALIGLNYTGTRYALRGCINDMNRMKTTLTKCGYKNISVFTDKNLTTENNVLDVLNKLVSSDSQTLFFQYSGHGMQVQDRNNDEEDGLDEALASVNNTVILDDDINNVIKKVKAGTTMIIVIDACHSGTIIDLPYQLNSNGNVIKINENQVSGDIICISGCADNQVSLDITCGATSYGAMSNALQKVIKSMKNGTTWKELLFLLRYELKQDKTAQIPQLCVSRAELIDSVVKL